MKLKIIRSMKIQDQIQIQIQKLIKERGRLCAKLSGWQKRKKDTAQLEAEIFNIRQQIKELRKEETTVSKTQPVQTVKVIEKDTKKSQPVVEDPTKKYTKKQLEKCQQEIDKMLDNNDWVDGYQFRSSENMYIPKIYTQINKGEVEVCFTIQYKTKVHRVEKTITKRLNPDNYKRFQKYIDDVETWVMLNSGDMDDKDIVFGQRFNMVQFEKQGFESRGWVKYR